MRSAREVIGQKVMSIYWLLICFTVLITGLLPPLMGHPWHKWMMGNINLHSNAAAMALFPPWILVAAYRAMKANSVEALVFTLSGVLVALGNVPIGQVAWSGFPVLGGWLTQKLTASVFRAITIGIGLGLCAMALRIYLRMEKSMYREVEV
jgi:hypothetical protein